MTWFRRLSIRATLAKDSAQNMSTTTTGHALRYPELSRLPKAPNIRSIRFKRTNPGTVSHLNFGPDATPVIDPSHPLARLRLHQLMRVVPHYHCSLFGAHAYPQAVLRKFEVPKQMIQFKDKGSSNELANLIAGQIPSRSRKTENSLRPVAVGDRRRVAHTVPMSLMIVTPKKPLHKSATIRTKIKLRLKEALSLVAIRGASAPGPENRIMLTTPEGFHGKNLQASILLQGWTYVIRPSLEVYRCPWPSLLEHLREGLLKIQSHAMSLEAKWEKGSCQAELAKGASSQQKGGRRQWLNANSNVKRIYATHSSKTPPERNHFGLPRDGSVDNSVLGGQPGSKEK